MTFNVNGTTVITTDRIVVLTNGTTASRPASPVVGQLFFDTTLGQVIVWNGSAWRIPATTGGSGAISHAWTWGAGSNGRLGTNSTTSRSSPGSVVGSLNDWVQISAGSAFTTALRANGQAWAWGRNAYGQLGDNSDITKSSPVSVVGGFTDWIQISSGSAHTVAIRANGQAWAWGRNPFGQLGTGNILNSSSPVSVVGSFTDWIQISCGSYHTAAIRANGQAWAWGRNDRGQLGTGTVTSTSSPVSVVGSFTDWIQISCGGYFTAAIRANGQAWCWGRNNSGQLGIGSTVYSSSPVSVVGGFTDWVQIGAGTNHTAAIRANGQAWCWGSGSGGVLGTGNTTNRSSPVSVVGGFSDWVQISVSLTTFTVAIRANGQAWSWGSNITGSLGDGTSTSRTSPVSVVGGFTDWVQVSAGANFVPGTAHTVAIRSQPRMLTQTVRRNTF